MGTQFFWIFDAAVASVFIGFVFAGIKRGFISVLLSFAALLLAFCTALFTSDGIAVAIYDNIVSDAVTDEVSAQIDSMMGGSVISDLKSVDMSKAKVNGKSVSEVIALTDNVGRISIDLSRLDLSETGLEDIDLSSLGVSSENADYSSVNLGMAEYLSADAEKYGFDTLILSSVIAEKISEGTAFVAIIDIVNDIRAALPSFVSGLSEEKGGTDESVVEKIIVNVLNNANTDNLAHDIADNMIRPTLLVPMRALIFVIIFVIIMIVINLLSRMFKTVNHIPVLGGINRLLGAAAGFVQGAVVIFLVCIFVQVVISLTGNEIIFMNTMTIDETYIFKHIYYFDFLDFMA
ncbi:MAG: CvpA family protein [Bacteroides sp.]|nr:CvpA family protein [Bacteroides sp.]